MLVRILTGIVAFLAFLPFLIFSDTIAFPIAMAICAVVSTYEMVRCVGLHKRLTVTLPTVAAAAALPILMRLDGQLMFKLAPAVALVLMLYMLGLSVFSHGRLPINEAMTALAVSLYIVAGFTCMVYLHDLPSSCEYLYLLVFIGAWVPDTFAYFTGKLFGRHKLIPDVSPKKTVEGAVGGVLFCVLAFVGFGLLNNALWLTEGERALPIWLMAVIGLIAAVVSMVGDLSMSVIKRHYGIKDYGRILPGHGGFLDRFDSVLAVAVILGVAFGAAALAGVL